MKVYKKAIKECIGSYCKMYWCPNGCGKSCTTNKSQQEKPYSCHKCNNRFTIQEVRKK